MLLIGVSSWNFVGICKDMWPCDQLLLLVFNGCVCVCACV